MCKLQDWCQEENEVEELGLERGGCWQEGECDFRRQDWGDKDGYKVMGCFGQRSWNVVRLIDLGKIEFRDYRSQWVYFIDEERRLSREVICLRLNIRVGMEMVVTGFYCLIIVFIYCIFSFVDILFI